MKLFSGHGLIGSGATLFAAQVHATEAPLNYFLHSHGPAAYSTMVLDWVFTGITSAVCVIIAILLLAAIFRKRPLSKSLRDVGREEGGMRWIIIGTSISIAVLFAMAVYALVVLNETAEIPKKPGLTLTVTGYDWWWKAEYEDADPAQNFIAANEIHIPVGIPVLIKLKSADVIHAFWVPQLAGKTEMIPGLTNQQWLEADEPGIYRGKCTQFCGVQHAHMDFEVVAESPEDFTAWEEAQRKPVASSQSAGKAIFMENCAGCHSVRGTEAKGEHAPDLTHLVSRRLLAAGIITNTPDHLLDWVRHAQEIKPDSQMPDFDLNPKDASALSAYLATLK